MILTNTLIQNTIAQAYCCMAEKSAEYSKHLSYGKNDTCILKEVMLLQKYVSILQDFEIIVDPEDQVCLTNDDIIKIIKKIKKICEFCCCSEIQPTLVNGKFYTPAFGTYVVDNTTIVVDDNTFENEECNPPTIQANFIAGIPTYDPISGTYSANLTWTRGNGNNVIIIGSLITPTSPQWPTPVNGTTYTADNIFGSGDAVSPGYFVVYNGSGTTVTVTNITPVPFNLGNYGFNIYEYNDQGICYLSPPAGLQFVAPDPPSMP